MPGEYTVLVAGSRQVDAGKTTLATGIVHGLEGVGLKPRGGNNYWYDYDTVQARLSEGRLVGKDATRLAAVANEEVVAEKINPVHRLWRPISSGTGAIFGRETSEFLVDRVGVNFVVNGETKLPSEVVDMLPLEDAFVVNSLQEMNELMVERHQSALQTVRPIVEERDRVVLESYSDVARPIRDVDIDVAAVVGAGTVDLFDGDRYCRAASVVSGTADLGQLEERVGDVVSLIEPAESYQLQPLQRSKRTDPATVADVYSDFIDGIRQIAHRE